MNSRVKLFFIFLAVLAVISVFSFFDILGGVRSAKLSDTTKPLLPIEDDTDQDGLSNTDESYWNTDFKNPDTDGDGFLDGEEVASGFDPREPSSHELGDNLEDTVYGTVKTFETGDFEETNFTDYNLGMLASGIVAGDLKKDADPDKRDTALTILADSTIDNFHKSLPVFSPRVLGVTSDSQDDQTKYLESMAQVIKENLIDLPLNLDLDQNPFAQTVFFQTKANRFKLSLENASLLSVPQSWVETHKKILNLLSLFQLTYSAVANYENDSVKSIIAFNDIAGLNVQTKDILEEIKNKVTANDLKPNDIVFKIIDAIY